MPGHLEDMNGVNVLAALYDKGQGLASQLSKKEHCHGQRLSLQGRFPGAILEIGVRSVAGQGSEYPREPPHDFLPG
jgi:hypothetical protein